MTCDQPLPDVGIIAVDWGTTNRRLYVIDALGTIIAQEQDDRGVLNVPAGTFGAEVAAIRARFDDQPVLLSGMIGSASGWVEVPYLPCPAGLVDLAAGLHWIDPCTAIVPGLSIAAPRGGDVMRGEEVQLLGAVVAGRAPGDALLCQPGTHCKWAQINNGRIERFSTAMTGELFALLRKHSLLADLLVGPVVDGPTFREGVVAARRSTLLGDLFRVRAAILRGLRQRDEAASFVSGLLIGTDVREQAIEADAIVYVVADAPLGALYATALTEWGACPVPIDSHAGFVAGITRIWNLVDAP